MTALEIEARGPVIATPPSGALLDEGNGAPGGAPLVAQIAELIGPGATARLLASFGGRRIYISSTPGRGEAMARVVGEAAARKLGSVFGGERLWLPKGATSRVPMRIRKLRRRGMSFSQIARTVGCSERYAYRILAKNRESR